MSDIFLSYSRSNIATASRLVEAMSSRGWSIWWDSRIGAGLAWELEIDTELSKAGCVVVLWSFEAVTSPWVRAEASDALQRGVLVPARIDDATPPALFRSIQTTDLTPWLTNAKDPALGRLFDGIDRALGRSAGTRDPVPQPAVATGVKVRSAFASRSVPRKRPEARRSAATPRKARAVASSRSVNVFVQLHPGTEPPGRPAYQLPGIALYEGLQLRDVPHLSSSTSVASIDSPDSLAPGYVQVGSYSARRPRETSTRTRTSADRGSQLVGIVDIGGFDFAHPDFLDPAGRTRFVSIWDQAGRVHRAPDGFNRGSELTEQMMSLAIREAPRYRVAAQELEPQSSMSPGSRATHMASVAAGNTGLCPRALLAGVVLPRSGMDTTGVAIDATAVALGVHYLFRLGAQLKIPVSIAIGVGTKSATHDESSGIARWLDASLAPGGRCICVGAHAAHQSAPAVIADWDERFARTHTSGKIRDTGLTERIEWIVNGDGLIDLCENELHIWYEAQDRFAVSLKPPGSGEWVGPIQPGEFLENQTLENGTVVSIYNDRLAAPATGNRIACFLSPRSSADGVGGVAAGTWRVRLQGLTIRDGRYHGWVVRGEAPDGDSVPMFPAHFSERSSVPGFSVTGLACARDVLTVANLDMETEVIHPSSAKGPTRDGKAKPEVAAPGTNVVAANGFDSPNPLWISMTGTSVAAAYAAGAMGLMLAQNPRLSAQEINDIVKTTAVPLPGTDFGWHDDAGYGLLDVQQCLREAIRPKRIDKRRVR